MRRFTWKVRVFLLSKDLRDHALIFPSDSDGRAQLFDVLCFKASEGAKCPLLWCSVFLRLVPSE